MPPRHGIRPATFAPVQRYPVASANGPYYLLAGSSVLLSRAGSNDPYGTYQCYWTPGDSVAGTPRPEQGPYTGVAGDISISYATPGTYWATLRVVSDTTGLESIARALVVVQTLAAVASVVIDPDVVAGAIGGSALLQATAYDSNGFPITDRPFTWTTRNGAIASLRTTTGPSVTVDLVAAGETAVYVTCGGIQSADASVVVGAAVEVYQIVVTPSSVSGNVGDSFQLTATVTD